MSRQAINEANQPTLADIALGSVLTFGHQRFAPYPHMSKEKTMIKETVLRLVLAFAIAISPVINAASESNEMMTPEHPYVFHLIQAEL